MLEKAGITWMRKDVFQANIKERRNRIDFRKVPQRFQDSTHQNIHKKPVQNAQTDLCNRIPAGFEECSPQWSSGGEGTGSGRGAWESLHSPLSLDPHWGCQAKSEHPSLKGDRKRPRPREAIRSNTKQRVGGRPRGAFNPGEMGGARGGLRLSKLCTRSDIITHFHGFR